MRPPGPGVWITGPSRSGTSMVAGLFAEHGVFFGRTGEGNEYNAKGYFEHPELSARVRSGTWADWPEAFWKTLAGEGYEAGLWWGVKKGPRSWPWVQELGPELIVICERPANQIEASRARIWPLRGKTSAMVRQTAGLLEEVRAQATCPVFKVRTPRMIGGDYRQIARAFRKVGMSFDVGLADEWIDRRLWNQGLRKVAAQ